jgi:broad specificity phosphatase PhoE
MATARLLAQRKSEFCGRVVFLFQPSEERIPGGARPMIEDGALDGVDAIFVGHNKRTEQTAGVLAGRLNLAVEARDQENLVSYIRYVMRHHGGEIVLVVADGEMIPAMLDELHGSKRLPPFDPNDFDEIYIVTSPWYGKVKTLRLHYGASSGFAVKEPSAESGG